MVNESVEVQALADRTNSSGYEGLPPRLSIYHQREWREVVKATFGHKDLFLVTLEHGQPIDVLPLFLVRSPLFGRKLVSTPYEACYGGISVRTPAVVSAVIREVKRLAKELGLAHIEIRDQHPIPGLTELGFVEQSPFLISTLALRGVDENWNMLTAHHRRNVRLARRKGVTVDVAATAGQMTTFHRLISQHHRKVGLPFPSKRFFDHIWRHLVKNDLAVLLIARIGDEVVGGHLLFVSGRNLISKYAAYRQDEKYKRSYTSYSLIWESIRMGAERGFDTLNMGITGRLNGGLLDFKSRFGCETSDSHFYVLRTRGNGPDYSRYYGGYRLLKRMWSLTPSIVTSPIGHQLCTWFC